MLLIVMSVSLALNGLLAFAYYLRRKEARTERALASIYKACYLMLAEHVQTLVVVEPVGEEVPAPAARGRDPSGMN